MYVLGWQRTCSAIYEREMHLADLRDHLLLAAGVLDEAVTGKLAKLFAMSDEAIQLVTGVKASFPGAGASVGDRQANMRPSPYPLPMLGYARLW